MGTTYVIRILDNVISQLFSRVNFDSTPPLLEYFHFRINICNHPFFDKGETSDPITDTDITDAVKRATYRFLSKFIPPILCQILFVINFETDYSGKLCALPTLLSGWRKQKRKVSIFIIRGVLNLSAKSIRRRIGHVKAYA